MSPDYSLMLHGGAGSFEHADDPQHAEGYQAALRAVLEHGRRLLEQGASALDTVEACAALLEDEPLFNAGRGAVLNEDGAVELDAGIMCGASRRAGAVAALSNIANPIRLARAVLADGRQVLLVGAGARQFAARQGMAVVPDAYFVTPERRAEWERVRQSPPQALPDGGLPHGTIGAVARDRRGDLAAATSTGGMVNKPRGRVGDSPIVGAGVYADNASCAVSCTGVGEDLLRTVLAKTLADLIALRGLDGPAAACAAIAQLERQVQGRGGCIAIDASGRCSAAWNTRHMVHGWIEHGGASHYRF